MRPGTAAPGAQAEHAGHAGQGGHRLWEVRLKAALAQGGQRFTLDVDLARDAQRLVLFGPSGAGKSLTLRMMAGVLTPQAGRVAVAGRVLFD